MRSPLGFPGADDPAYASEFGDLAGLCAAFEAAFADDDFDGCLLLLVGLITAQCAAIYQLSPPAGIFDPADLFRRAASRADGPEDVSPKEGTEPSGA